ncbi:MAG: hypothetical protein AB8B55_15045 [Mariniblastus sp.]
MSQHKITNSKAIAGLIICVVTFVGFGCSPRYSFAAPKVQSIQEADLEVTRAREKASSAQKRYETTKALSQKGSASKRKLRISELQRDLAILELSSLLEPSRKQKNMTTAAKLVLKYRNQELAIVRQLYKRGSASEVSYRRALVARDVARSDAEAMVSATETQRKLKVIEAAKSKYDLARKEFEIAERLLKSGSIAQPDYNQFASKLKLATAEWESMKKSLGAKATVVKQ